MRLAALVALAYMRALVSKRARTIGAIVFLADTPAHLHRWHCWLKERFGFATHAEPGNFQCSTDHRAKFSSLIQRPIPTIAARQDAIERPVMHAHGAWHTFQRLWHTPKQLHVTAQRQRGTQGRCRREAMQAH